MILEEPLSRGIRSSYTDTSELSVGIDAADDRSVNNHQIAYVSAKAPGFGYPVARTTVLDSGSDPRHQRSSRAGIR